MLLANTTILKELLAKNFAAANEGKTHSISVSLGEGCCRTESRYPETPKTTENRAFS